MRFREVREPNECKKEKNLPYYEDEPTILKSIKKENEERRARGEHVMTFEEAQSFWDNLFASDVE